MLISTSHQVGNVRLLLAAHRNCDDVFLAWRTAVSDEWDVEVPNCLGFMIQRQRRRGDDWGPIEILRNRVGFVDTKPEDGDDVESGVSRPSNVWPFQRYDWTDHGADTGDFVRYRVVAVGPGRDTVVGRDKLEEIADSGWTDQILVTAACGDGTSAYFNRGFVMSQFVARLMRKNGWKATDLKEHVKDLEEPLRQFLSGDLRLELLHLLDEAIEDTSRSVYAALYELSDEELIDRLSMLKDRAHVVLSNGSNKKGDGNEAARGRLRQAEVDVRDRLLGSKGLGHNKFAVVEQHGKPVKAWSGSTNWSASGLCTQVNNGILFDDEGVARLYKDQWERLARAGNQFPDDLVKANAQSPRAAGNTDVWFTCVRRRSKKNTGPAADIDALVNLVQSAKHAILYVMFQPGEEPLGSIVQQAQGGLYVRGVVSTLTSSAEEKFTLSGIDTRGRQYKTALVQPEGVQGDLSAWIAEVTRAEFLYPNEHPGVGHAITHAKMIVIDPWDEGCAVVTGSHNFSVAASEANDENFVVVRGNRQLAEAYAVACVMTYEHYRWRAYLKDKAAQHRPAWSHTKPTPAWQTGYVSKEKTAHLNQWCPLPP